MSHFDEAIKVILHHEGGLADNKNDPGGITVYGISLRFLESHAIDIDGDGDTDADDIRALIAQPELAIKLYHDVIWGVGGFDRFLNFYVATKLFDIDVNAGPKRANTIAQEAANLCGARLMVDGAIGPKSVEAINAIDPFTYVEAVKRKQAAFYRDLAMRKPSLAEFLPGWLKRAQWPKNMET
jgi:type VI secretion system secreted protein VgrG